MKTIKTIALYLSILFLLSACGLMGEKTVEIADNERGVYFDESKSLVVLKPGAYKLPWGGKVTVYSDSPYTMLLTSSPVNSEFTKAMPEFEISRDGRYLITVEVEVQFHLSLDDVAMIYRQNGPLDDIALSIVAPYAREEIEALMYETEPFGLEKIDWEKFSKLIFEPLAAHLEINGLLLDSVSVYNTVWIRQW